MKIITNHLFQLALVAIVAAAITLTVLEISTDESAPHDAIAIELTSTLLTETRRYEVFLPERFDTSQAYSVLYMLDGGSQAEHAAQSAALLARLGMIPPLIVIGIDNMGGVARNRDYTPPDMKQDADDPTSAKGAADRFIEHLQTELIPDVERRYKTHSPRLLAGWSRGGLLATYASISAPDLFDGFIALSPALWRDEKRIIQHLKQALSTEPAQQHFLYLSLGAAENDKMKAAFDDAVTLLRSPPFQHLSWRADISAGGAHDNNAQRTLPIALCHFFNTADHSCGKALAQSKNR